MEDFLLALLKLAVLFLGVPIAGAVIAAACVGSEWLIKKGIKTWENLIG